MKIVEVIIENFFQIGARQRLGLADRGLLLVQGINEEDESADSNGAGKSTIADAICWCLYGETARGVSGDAVVNRFVKKNTSVTTIIDDAGSRYLVFRYRKHNKHKNNLKLIMVDSAGKTVDLTKGTDKLTQKEVDKVVGCTLDVFRAAVYSGQEMLPNLPAMTDKELKLIVEEAAGVNELQEAYQIASKKFLAQADIVKDCENKIAITTQQCDDAVAHHKDLMAAVDSWEDDRRTNLNKLGLNIKGQAVTANALKKQIEAANIPTIEAEIAALNAQIDGVAGELTERQRLEQVLSAAKVEQGKMRAAVDMAADLLKREQNALKAVDARIGAPCGECGKAYHAEDLHTAKQLAAKKVADAVAKYKQAKEQLDAATTAVSGAQTALETYVRGMTDLSAVRAQLDAVTARRASVSKLEHDWALTVQRVKNDKLLYDQIKAHVNPYISMRDEAENKAHALDNHLRVLTEALDTYKKGLDVYGMAKEVFGPAGVRAHILDTVTPFLNDRTAKYLGALSDGNISATWQTLTKNAKGELREKFQILVTNDKGAESFAGLSGGEKRKVRLACALALQDLVASRATKPIDLWVGDEIDDALDVSGLERLMGILEEKARERGTVLIVSHADLKDWCRQVITVRKRGGFSEIEDMAHV
jgi:DNA repair exonuclease SbcCD ATPase subunit